MGEVAITSALAGHMEVVGMFSKRILPLVAALVVALFSQVGVRADGTPVTYTGGNGAVVVRADGQAIIDNGGVICRADGQGAGGACLPFPAQDPGTPPFAGVHLTDGEVGENVAFQVCIDNNGDGICGGPDGNSKLPCGDDMFFSHDDQGRFFNPLGPLPTSYRKDCPGGQTFRGYVVLLCTGVHEVATSAGAPDAHAHPATTGQVVTTRDGEGSGDFCGGDGIRGATGDFVAKAYVVE